MHIYTQIIDNNVKCDARNHGKASNENCKNARNWLNSIIQRRHIIET